ncbi:MAG: pentapeptide repeat-containing protein, partial [Chlorogloeopsis fritschii C42_A2020_084]|nr:pentapeptide repeat-containing protein [Chlorogloeopsis fritschii C42_A2020_084]
DSHLYNAQVDGAIMIGTNISGADGFDINLGVGGEE